jgi:hypothetical protein
MNPTPSEETNMLTKVLFAHTAIALALAAASCAAPVQDGSADAESTATERSAMMARTPAIGVVRVATGPVLTGTVATAQYSCGATECSCTGDADCNKMFSANVCDGDLLSANCDVSNGVKCTCTKRAQ